MKINIRKISLLSLIFHYGKYCAKNELIRIFFRTLIEMRSNTIIIAFNDDNVFLGYCVARPCPAKFSFRLTDEWIIGLYYVLESFRGMGIGTRLLAEMDNFCSSDSICAYVLKDNIGSNISFKKAGYVFLGEMYKKEDNTYSICDSGDFYVYRKQR